MNLYNFYSEPKELNGYEDQIYFFPYMAFVALKTDKNRNDRDRLEDTIAKYKQYSYNYALRIIKKPFPKGEDAIAKDAWLSLNYARNVLKGPFPKGEEAIKNSEFWDRYQYFLKGLK